jgi:hypothetical protein
LTRFISPSPLSGTEWTQTKSYCIDGIGKYGGRQELHHESRDRSSGWVISNPKVLSSL